MKARQLLLVAAVLALNFAGQAQAASGAGAGIEIPEPTDLALFLIGVAGLLIGRRSSLARRRPDSDQDA